MTNVVKGARLLAGAALLAGVAVAGLQEPTSDVTPVLRVETQQRAVTPALG